MSRFFSNYFDIKSKPSGEPAVYSKIKFNKNDIVYEFVGERTEDVLPDDNKFTQVGNKSYLKPTGSFDDYTNHSCVPNCYVKFAGERVFLVALHQINPGDEVTWDYSTTSTEDKSTFLIKCSCGNFKCRKEISGFQYLSEEEKDKYKNLKIIPDYLAVK